MEESLSQRMRAMREEKPTKSQRRLLEYFLRAEPRKASLRSINEIAAELDIADATVLRFCRALGFEGYRDFRMALASEGVPAAGGHLARLTAQCTEQLRSCVSRFDEGALERAAGLIRNAHTVCCLGMGTSFYAASLMRECLLGLGVACFCEHDSSLTELFLATRGGEDVLLLFGTDSALDRCIALARARGLGIVSVMGERMRTCCDAVLAEGSGTDAMTELFAVVALSDALSRSRRDPA